MLPAACPPNEKPPAGAEAEEAVDPKVKPPPVVCDAAPPAAASLLAAVVPNVEPPSVEPEVVVDAPKVKPPDGC